MPLWYNPERGYWTATYKGKKLEIVRNQDPSEARRYVARVDGAEWPNPCHTLAQCKTKAMKWADNPGLHVPADVPEPLQEVDP